MSYYHPIARSSRNSSLIRSVFPSLSNLLGYDYYDRGPFEFQYNDDILEPEAGRLPSYEFHWRVSDYVQAMLDAGCRLLRIDEMGTHVGEWEGAPLDGLPEYLLLVGQKS